MSGQPVPSPLSPAKLAYSGSPFPYTGVETIPSDFPVVMLQIPFALTAMGSPTIADGQFVGQRLLVMIDPNSAGDLVYFAIHPLLSPTVQPVLSPIALHRYGGPGNYAEQVEWVWDGMAWQLVAVFNPSQAPLSTMGQLYDVLSYYRANSTAMSAAPLILGGEHVAVDPVGSVSLDVLGPFNQGASILRVELTTASLVLNGTPTFIQSSHPLQHGQLLLVYLEDLGNDFTLSLVDFNIQPTGLQLFTPGVVLQPRESLLLRWNDNVSRWVEVFRSAPRATRFFAMTGDPSMGAASFDFLQLADIKLSVITGDLTLAGVPSLVPGVDGHELTIWMDPLSPFSLILNDISVDPNSALRLATGSVTLNNGESISLRYHQDTAVWYEFNRTELV